MVVSGDGLVRRSPCDVSNGEHQSAGAVADPSVSQRLPRDRGARPDWEFLEAELEIAIVHHDVDELSHMWTEHERCHARAADVLRVDDSVGAGAAKFLLAVEAPGPSDDE